MGDMIRVRATAPFKRGHVWFLPGDEAAVTPAEKAELARAGVIEEADADASSDVAPGGRSVSGDDWDAAVAATAQAIAESIVEAAVEAAVAPLVAEGDAAVALIAELRAGSRAPHEPGSDGKAQAADPAPAQKPAPKARAARG